MDSITQFALGAAVSGVLLGPKIGARKAVLLGGVLGTLPDLDTFCQAQMPSRRLPAIAVPHIH